MRVSLFFLPFYPILEESTQRTAKKHHLCLHTHLLTHPYNYPRTSRYNGGKFQAVLLLKLNFHFKDIIIEKL